MTERSSVVGAITRRLGRLALLAFGLFGALDVLALTVEVRDPTGNPVPGFRWLIEEDTTYRQPVGTTIDPGDPAAAQVQSFNFFKSYMPVVDSGASATASADITLPDPGKHYFISVLPQAGHGMNGKPIAPGQENVVVVVNSLPTPTAQIFVVAFHDNNPINNALDQPQEAGIGGFSVRIDDTIDAVKQDAFGNPLGTVYERNADNTPVFDADGNPVVRCMGSSVVTTVTQADIIAAAAGDICRNPYNLQVGEALIKNLHPAKYGVQVVPPTGSPWQQTSTIEGKKTIDAWVKANEPPYFAEFGAGIWHTSFGFVQPFNALPTGGSGAIMGRIVNMHMARPPEYTFSAGHPLPNCWVGLNEGLLGGLAGPGLYAAPCNEDSTFTIPNVPPGTYELVMWDKYLNNIFGFHRLVVPEGGGDVALGDVPVFRWFGAHDHYVFYDANENGVRDPGERGIPEQAVILRHRDGSIYQSYPTDMDGYVPFDEIFPFFFWQVAEVDFARYKATGVTVTVDAGGVVDTANEEGPGRGKLTPQIQDDGALVRTETGPVLTQAYQSFLGTTNVFEWGKKNYAPGENGGISGIVHYATTRAEDDPRMTGAEDWEPGIPRVQVNLYRDNGSGGIADANGNGAVDLADVDNHPFGWSEGGTMGPEDIKRNTLGGPTTYDAGDAIQTAYTDSWDDNLPEGCPAGNAPGAASDPFYQNGKCYDGLRNYNQVRPGLFDGGYAFTSYHPGGKSSGSPEQLLTAGLYVVEAATPKGYVHQKEQDKNVDFGDEFTPSPLLLPPVCVNWDDVDSDGQPGHTVPAELALFPGVPAPFAGQARALCDRKQILLADRQNAAVDFFMFTEVPIAGHIQGFVLNDLANEFDINSPQFGEKQTMPSIPVSIRDWTGREINRVYTDQYGSYNALVPATYTMNRPSPSGVSPSMMQACVNDPGPIVEAGTGRLITDPQFARQYTQFCYTYNFLPGTTTFLDTPVLPIAAFATLRFNPVDAEFAEGTPQIHSVSGPLGGPYVPAGGEITITSMGTVHVPNPGYSPEGPQPRTVARDYGFGSFDVTLPATVPIVRIGNTTLTVTGGDSNSITAQVPAGTPTGQLSVTRRDNGRSTIIGVTVTTGTTTVVHVPPGGSIQAAIDSAPAGSLVLVPPGSYEEMVILYKNVRLQGWGPGSTIINGTLAPSEKTAVWRQKVTALLNAGLIELVPGQEPPTDDVEAFLGSEGAPIFVATRPGQFISSPRPRIDGFSIIGSTGAGGIVVNGYANFLEISNNRITNNQGIYGGGIRLGHPLIADAFNDRVSIHHNQVCENGTLQMPGGGIAIYGGSDNYDVTDNYICANFAQGDGGGIAHYGLSDDGRIAHNTILFNQTFSQEPGTGGAGGGVFIAGVLPAGAALTSGAGSVVIDSNLIQGNNAGTGDGAGIAALRVNGADVQAAPGNPRRWHRLDILNNIIVNNVSGQAGALALQDAVRTNIIHNTVARNDSTGTAAGAFQSTPSCTADANQSCPQPAGVIALANSAALQTVIDGAGGSGREYSAFSNPLFANNIVWQNRSFYYSQTPTAPGLPGTQPVGRLLPDVENGEAPVFNDLAVLGVSGQLDPRSSVLTSTAGYHASNTAGDPAFIQPYYNSDRSITLVQPEFTSGITVRAALDEGGNYIEVFYGPLTLSGNYHLQSSGSAAMEHGSPIYLLAASALLRDDVDSETRPACRLPDAGADEVQGPCPAAVASTADIARTQRNRSVVINVLANDRPVTGAATNSLSTLGVLAVQTPTAQGGIVEINPDHSVTYTPAPDWSGADSFTYAAGDGRTLTSSPVTVTVDADSDLLGPPTADEPVAAPRTETEWRNAGTGVDAGAQNAEARAASPVAAAESKLAPTPVDAAGAQWPSAPVDTKPSSVMSAKAAPQETTSFRNMAPIANDDEVVLRADSAGRYVYDAPGLLENDAVVEGDGLRAVLVEDVNEGQVTLDADGRFVYTPPATGVPTKPVSFTYRLTDGSVVSRTATVTFVIEQQPATTPSGEAGEEPRAEDKPEPLAPSGDKAGGDVAAAAKH